MISLEKLKILTPLQKLPNNVGDLGKIIVAKSFFVVQSPINLPIWSHCTVLSSGWFGLLLFHFEIKALSIHFTNLNNMKASGS